MNYRDFDDEQLILRDLLALERTRLANERTFLAYVRTAIMVGVSGVSFIKLFPNSHYAQVTGWALLPMAVSLMLFATIRFFQLRTLAIETPATTGSDERRLKRDTC